MTGTNFNSTFSGFLLLNRRMPKCNTVLQSENDLFEPEIQPNSHGNCQFLALTRTIKSSKCFGHCPVNGMEGVRRRYAGPQDPQKFVGRIDVKIGT